MIRLLLVVTSLLLFAFASFGHSQSSEQPLTFVADLRGELVAPAPVDTPAMGKATGVLVGNRFTVHGSFSELSSPLRNFDTKPDDPGVHLHRGAPGETHTLFPGLQVPLNADERSGIFFGTAVLDEDQLKRLLATETYVDIHTVKHGPGELRDQWRPLDSAEAARVRASREGQHASAQQLVSTSCH